MSSDLKSFFITLPPLEVSVEDKLFDSDYYYKIESIDVKVGDELSKGQIVGKFGVYIEKCKQSFWKKELISKKEGTVKKINIFKGSRVIPGYVICHVMID